MRRKSPGALAIAEAQKKLLAVLSGCDVAKICAVLEEIVLPQRRARLLRVIEARVRSVTILMDAPHDPHNGAAVLRSSDAFGLARIHVIERKDTFLAAKTVSRGSERWVDVKTYTAVEHAVTALRADGYELCATHPEGALLPEDLAKRPRVAIVLGNERDGIGDDLAGSCETSVRIPMRGFAESLNVSVTAAILLQQAMRERPGDLSAEERALLYARGLIFSVAHAAEVLQERGLVPDPLPEEALALVKGR